VLFANVRKNLTFVSLKTYTCKVKYYLRKTQIKIEILSIFFALFSNDVENQMFNFVLYECSTEHKRNSPEKRY
jgi:hypothetical protein